MMAEECLLSRCAASSPPLIAPDPHLPGEGEESLLARLTTLKPVQWEPDLPFIHNLTEARQPALLRGTVVDSWAARNWTWDRLAELHAGETLPDVMQSDGHMYLVPDEKAALEPLLSYHLPHRFRNMSSGAFFDEMRVAQARYDEHGYSRTAAGRARWRQRGRRLVHFAQVSAALAAEMEPRELLFRHAEDSKSSMQYLWLSTPGVRTHTHFDSDHNVFVQLVGRKRFVLWAPNETERLCMFPRLHPLWHKSRVDFEAPNTSPPPCAAYGASEAVVVEVGPGDVLYVPPMWWHTVETLSPSASLSTLSRYRELYAIMRGTYTMTYYFDKLAHYEARVYALRLYLVLLVRRLHPEPPQPGEPPAEVGFFRRLAARYAGLEHLFQREAGDADMCVLGARGTPTCNNCLANIKSDAVIIWDEHFAHLPADVLAPIFDDYVEELTLWVVGAGKALPFWQHCFGRQGLYKTTRNTEEHLRLWQEISYNSAHHGWFGGSGGSSASKVKVAG